MQGLELLADFGAQQTRQTPAELEREGRVRVGDDQLAQVAEIDQVVEDVARAHRVQIQASQIWTEQAERFHILLLEKLARLGVEGVELEPAQH
jgi:hypothetical protein